MPKIVDQAAWIEARKALMVKEKELQRAKDALAEERRALPWVKLDKDYAFEGSDGALSLSDLFGDQSQLIVWHFMFGPDWEAGCKSCSFWADSYNPGIAHLKARDVSLVAVSTAPLDKIEAYRSRMGWSFPWVSDPTGDFGADMAVHFTADQVASKDKLYNFGTMPAFLDELQGLSVFTRDEDGAIYRTYSTYARGVEPMNTVYQHLDLVPKGRDENGQGMAWLRRHDEYETA